MSNPNEERNIIEKLCMFCLNKLRINRYKKHWNDLEYIDLFTMLKNKVLKLKEAINSKKTPEEVWKEAADVANFCAMIADNYEKENR